MVSLVWFFFPVEKEFPLHHVQGSTTVDYVHPLLRLCDRFWLGCVFDRNVAFEERRFVHVCESTFYLVDILVEFPRLKSCLVFLMLFKSGVW